MLAKEQVEQYLIDIISKESDLQPSEIKPNDSFFELGFDSISAIYLLELVETRYGIELTPLDFWDYPTIESFTDYLITKKLPA